MLAAELIRKKRDGGSLGEGELREFVDAITAGRVSDAQVAAFTMAVCLRGMNADETAALTVAMRDSGDTIAWPSTVVDKHSTGGVGDCISLALAPIAAACGVTVPMISGRGLGHSGGTLDKLDSIPGYNTAPDMDAFRRAVDSVGCAIIGQTADLAPADKRIYAVRDATGTVESAALITASILSKKLAAGVDALVMDVKCGNGAFAANVAAADELVDSLNSTARSLQLPVSTFVTDMNQPLAPVAGNALEVAFSVKFLRGEVKTARFATVTVALAAEMLRLADVAEGPAAVAMVEAALSDGRAVEVFGAMVHAMGGAADFVDNFAAQLPVAAVTLPVLVDGGGGVVTGVDTRALGLSVVALGGGRRRAEDGVDYAIGLGDIAAVGDVVDAERPLATVHAADDAAAERAAADVRVAFTVADADTATDADASVILRRCDNAML